MTTSNETPKQLAPGCSFIDGDERAARSSTWEQPPMEERLALQPGDFAQIGMQNAHGGERPWIKVEAVTDTREVVGRINNHLTTDEYGVGFGDLVKVEMRHIINIYRE